MNFTIKLKLAEGKMYGEAKTVDQDEIKLTAASIVGEIEAEMNMHEDVYGSIEAINNEDAMNISEPKRFCII